MALKIEGIKTEIMALKTEKKVFEAEITALHSAPTFTALQNTIKQLHVDITNLSMHLDPLRAGMAAPVSATEKAAVDNDLFRFEKMQKARGKMFRELWSLAVESGEQNSKELWVSDACIQFIPVSSISGPNIYSLVSGETRFGG